MLHRNNRKEQKGFTIIEVLIVLAIAGLILLIVFLAVPALQRNSRNTSIKNDVQNVLGGVSEFQNANNGQMPTSVAGTGDVDFTKTGANTTSIKVQGTTEVSTATSDPGAPDNGKVIVLLGKRCDGSANTRAVSAYYSIETTSNSKVKQCEDS